MLVGCVLFDEGCYLLQVVDEFVCCVKCFVIGWEVMLIIVVDDFVYFCVFMFVIQDFYVENIVM